jgi:hypothetical protein
MRNILIAIAIAAIGGASVAGALIGRSGSNKDNTSIAAHVLITNAQAIGTALPQAEAPIKAHGQPTAASARIESPASFAASVSATGTVAKAPPRSDEIVSPARAPMPVLATSAETPAKAGATGSAAAAPTIAPVEDSLNKHRFAKKRRRPHRRLLSKFGERGCCDGGGNIFGGSRDQW